MNNAQQEAQRLRKEFGDKAVKVVGEFITIFNHVHKPEYVSFDALGDRMYDFDGEYDTHMTGYDMIEYYNQVKSELQKPVNDPFIDEVEEFHPILKKIRDMMKDLKPWISYDKLRVSDLPPVETFATCNGVGRRSITHYTDGYEKYRAVTND